METNKDEMITQSTILSMGWTMSLIKKHLSEPTLKMNPRYKSASSMKLWSKSLVLEAMETPEFKADHEKAKKRSERARANAKASFDRSKEKVAEIMRHVSIQILDDNELVAQALDYQQAIYDFEPWYDYHDMTQDAYSADEQTVHRWVVNYIRHQLIEFPDYLEYDNFFSTFDNKPGKDSLDLLIHESILQKIAEVYPKYQDECSRKIKDYYTRSRRR